VTPEDHATVSAIWADLQRHQHQANAALAQTVETIICQARQPRVVVLDQAPGRSVTVTAGTAAVSVEAPAGSFCASFGTASTSVTETAVLVPDGPNLKLVVREVVRAEFRRDRTERSEDRRRDRWFTVWVSAVTFVAGYAVPHPHL
jgi:hypothetical protein